jgi:hypothetical protein
MGAQLRIGHTPDKNRKADGVRPRLLQAVQCDDRNDEMCLEASQKEGIVPSEHFKIVHPIGGLRVDAPDSIIDVSGGDVIVYLVELLL